MFNNKVHLDLPTSLPKLRFVNWLTGGANDRSQQVNTLFHANTVATALTYLSFGGLVSRAKAETGNHNQTAQQSDADDKFYGIFDKIFLDPMDIHRQLHRRNCYGPVLFEFDVQLLRLDDVEEVRVARVNPQNWAKYPASNSERWLIEPTDVKDCFSRTNFDNHFVLTCRHDTLPFSPYLRRIILDNPKCKLPDGRDAFETAYEALEKRLGSSNIKVVQRACTEKSCTCQSCEKTQYQSRVYNKKWLVKDFDPNAKR